MIFDAFYLPNFGIPKSQLANFRAMLVDLYGAVRRPHGGAPGRLRNSFPYGTCFP